jgi:hypothetical protein
MSLTKSWYTIEEAASKFGLSSEELHEMVDSGLVRTEEYKGKAVMLNGDDIEQQLNMVPSVCLSEPKHNEVDNLLLLDRYPLVKEFIIRM